MSDAQNRIMIGELAAKAFLTIKAVRLYEKYGVVQPVRAENGRRYYLESDVRRLRHAMALKAIGMTLTEIGAALNSTDFDLRSQIARRRDELGAEKIRLNMALAVLGHASDAFERGKTFSLDQLYDMLIPTSLRVVTSMFPQEAQKLFGSMTVASAAASLCNTPSNSRVDFSAVCETSIPLQRELSLLAINGAGPDDARAQQLARDWRQMQKDMLTKFQRPAGAPVTPVTTEQKQRMSAASTKQGHKLLRDALRLLQPAA